MRAGEIRRKEHRIHKQVKRSKISYRLIFPSHLTKAVAFQDSYSEMAKNYNKNSRSASSKASRSASILIVFCDAEPKYD